jgi:hypothetical protein
MRTRAQGVLAFVTILTTCIAGILHLSWWAALAGACILVLISMSNHAVAHRALSGSANSSSILIFSSVLSASLTSASALAAGRAIGSIWGV